MGNRKLFRKILFKIVIVIILMDIFIIQYNLSLKNPFGETNSYINTGDNRIEFDESILLYRDIEYFFRCIQNNQYEKAFNILNDQCKEEVFNNNINDFIVVMKKCINNDICYKKMQYESIDFLKENRNNVYIIKSIVYFEKMNESYKGNIETDEMTHFFAIKYFNFKVIENKPFEYEYYLEVVGE